MGLNDEMEKLRQAREWITTLTVPDPRITAAWEHVRWVLQHSDDRELQKEAQDIATMVIRKGELN